LHCVGIKKFEGFEKLVYKTKKQCLYFVLFILLSYFAQIVIIPKIPKTPGTGTRSNSGCVGCKVCDPSVVELISRLLWCQC